MLRTVKSVFASTLRRQVVATAICTGTAYRVYSTWTTSPRIGIQKPYLPCVFPVLACSSRKPFPLSTNGSDPRDPHDPDCYFRRLAKLDLLNTWISYEVPTIFRRGLLRTVDIFDPKTVVEFERFGRSSVILRGPTSANLAFAVLRAYFFLISAGRRIDILYLNVDTASFTVETHLRLVLLPPPSREDSRLPPDQLRKILESHAKWIDFRVLIKLDDKGEIAHVKFTRTNVINRKYEWSLSKSKMRRFLPTPTPGVVAAASTLYSPEDIDRQIAHLLSHIESLSHKKKGECKIDLPSTRNEDWCEEFVYKVLFGASSEQSKYQRLTTSSSQEEYCEAPPRPRGVLSVPLRYRALSPMAVLFPLLSSLGPSLPYC